MVLYVMRDFLFSLLAFSLIRCSTVEVDRRAYVDPAFIGFVEQYEKDFDANIIGIPFDFDLLNEDEKDEDDDKDTAGKCVYNKNNRNKREIWIDIDIWEDMGRLQRRWLIYHEIAHCYENFEHRDFKLKDGCPGSITHYKIAPRRCIKSHWKYYKHEMFYRYNKLKWKKLYIDNTGGRIESR